MGARPPFLDAAATRRLLGDDAADDLAAVAAEACWMKCSGRLG